MKKIIPALLVLLCASSAAGQYRERQAYVPSDANSSFLIKMTSSMRASTSKVGDVITGEVIDPVQARGGKVQGTVERADHAILGFGFHSLEVDGKTWPVQSRIVSITSSAGNEGRDDLDQRIRVEGAGIIAYGTDTAVDEGAEVRLTIWKK